MSSNRNCEDQSRLAEKASRELRRIFEECLKNGVARAAGIRSKSLDSDWNLINSDRLRLSRFPYIL